MQQSRQQRSPAGLLAQLATPLPPLDDYEAFASVFDPLVTSNNSNVKVVLLGEATHGTSEFYRARALITRRLIEQHGFNLVCFEADYPDMAHVHRYVRSQAPVPFPRDSFVRFPQWMWRNTEFKEFAQWLRRFNASLPSAKRISLRGLDVYSLRDSVNHVIKYLQERDPAQAEIVRKRYECVTPHFEKASLLHLPRLDNSCQRQCVAVLNDLLQKRFEYIAANNGNSETADEAFLDAEQNARIVRAGEKYYTAQWLGGTSSWNIRDTHMFDTLLRMCAVKPNTKAVVWAHNSHLGNAGFTEMGMNGETNIGELSRKHFGDECLSIGFTTSVGTVAAASHWDDPVEFKTINPPRHDSWELALSQATNNGNALVSWRNNSNMRDELSAFTLLERAIGVVYVKHSERYSHYFNADLSHQFDAVVHFHSTTHVTPLPPIPEAPETAAEMDDTYPFGV